MAAGAESLLINFLPLLMLGAIYTAAVFIVARKRRINPWGWTLASLIPVIGQIVVAPLFLFLSFLSVLDRLHKLEMDSAFN